MNYVVLHVDLEFIVGIVCTDDGNSYPITNGKDDLLYLYFYNDPHTNKITFGKSNRDNANKEVNNYYGKFFHSITDGHTTFKRGEFEKDVIELLHYSDLLKTIKDKYINVTKDNTGNIPTLVTFSLSISDLAKQKTIEYLKNQGFQIDSYTIPLAELVGYYPYTKKKFLPINGCTIILLAATNATLHIMKLVFSNNYFMLDGEVNKYEGMGIDPRKRALVGFVVNQINMSVGALNQNEISSEIEKKEFKADEWLKKIDAKAKNDNSPIRITESLSPMPSSMRDVLVKKTDIETFTNDFVNLLMDYFNAYKSNNITGDIAGIFLLGDCFNNSLVMQRFSNLFRDDEERSKKLYTFTNKEIQDILWVYPKIDFRRYINEEERSKAKAEAELNKIAEQQAIDAANEVKKRAEKEKIEAEKKIEENRKEAVKLYERAVELEKESKLQDSLINLENAIYLDNENTEYKRFKEVVAKKNKELIDKTDSYKSWLKDAESYEQSDDLDLALKAYQNAQKIFDLADLRRKIVHLESEIERKLNLTKTNSFITIATSLADNGKFDDAIVNINKVLEIDPNNITAKETLNEIYKKQIEKETEKKYNLIIVEADKYFKESALEKAIEKYNEAYLLKPSDSFCKQQISNINKLIKQKENQLKGSVIIAKADEYLVKELWSDAKFKFEEALELCPNDKNVENKISLCSKKLKEIDGIFRDLLGDSIIAETKGTKEKLKEALDLLNKAYKLQPENIDIKNRIKRINNKLKFSDFGEDKHENVPKGGSNDFDLKFKVKTKEEDDDFLGIGNNKKTNIKSKTNDDDFFIGIQKQANGFLNEKEEESDRSKTNNKTDFDW